MSATAADHMIASTRTRTNRGNRMLYAFSSRPRDMGRYPGILVLHDIDGCTGTYEQMTRRLAAADYMAQAFDIYSRAEAPNPKKPLDDAEKRIKFFQKIPDQRVFEDLDKVWEVLAKMHWTRGQKLGVLGFGLGAYYALLFAGRNPDVAACVAVNPRYAFHQPEVTKRDLSKGVVDLKPSKFGTALTNTKADSVIFLSGQDEEMPLEDGRKLFDICDRQSLTYAQVVYEGAGPEFWDPDAASYDAAFADDMWDGALKFFKRTLK